MENLDKLQTRVKDILEQYKKLESAYLELKKENAQLRERLSGLESELKLLSQDGNRLEKQSREKQEAALKRISRLVDKIHQFQSEMKLS
ncbi:MAG: cell division protein ZapB [candidate division Zixibacteria bacterium]|nr:cell division protein ZapB [candidate division Zixibacteria bacterium]